MEWLSILHSDYLALLFTIIRPTLSPEQTCKLHDRSYLCSECDIFWSTIRGQKFLQKFNSGEKMANLPTIESTGSRLPTFSDIAGESGEETNKWKRLAFLRRQLPGDKYFCWRDSRLKGRSSSWMNLAAKFSASSSVNILQKPDICGRIVFC